MIRDPKIFEIRGTCNRGGWFSYVIVTYEEDRAIELALERFNLYGTTIDASEFKIKAKNRGRVTIIDDGVFR
jgi:hypothetical protein